MKDGEKNYSGIRVLMKPSVLPIIAFGLGVFVGYVLLAGKKIGK